MSASLSRLHKGGCAKLRFRCSPDGTTYICAQEVAYPFHITRPFYLEGDPEGMSTLYLQSVSGGLFDDDVVSLSLEAEPQSSAHVTTQSSTIVHEATTSIAVQKISITAKENAYIEYLPDPLVLFPGARLNSQIKVVADKTASVVVCDGFFSHDPRSSGAVFERMTSELKIETPQGQLRCMDRFEITGEQMASDPRFRAHGSFVCIDESLGESDRATINQAISQIPGIYAGLSSLPDGAGLWCRALAPDSQILRDGLGAAWRALRQIKTGLIPHNRRK